jgi:hypothetical protein
VALGRPDTLLRVHIVFVSTIAINNMQATHNSNPRKVRISVTGIDLTDMESASASLVARIGIALRHKSTNKDEATASTLPAPSLNAREVLRIDITDISPGQETSALIDLIPQLGTTLVSMTEEGEMASKLSSVQQLEAEYSSEDEGPSVNSEAALRGAQDFLSSWQGDLDSFEDDSEIYEKDEDTSAATKKTLKASQHKQPSQRDTLRRRAPASAVEKPQPFRVETVMQLSDAGNYSLIRSPGPLSKLRHTRVKILNMSVAIFKAEPIPGPMRREVCYAAEEEVRHESGEDVRRTSQANQPPCILAQIIPVPLSLQGERKWFFSEEDRPKLRRMKRGGSVARMPL